MTHHPVKSSAISSIGFDPDTNEMHVTFHNGTVSKHVTDKETYNKIQNSESVGKAYAVFNRKPKVVEKTFKFK